MLKVKAKVLWFDIRDGYGIVVDDHDNEYYISSDTCPKDLKSGEVVFGEVNPNIKDTLCLRRVER